MTYKAVIAVLERILSDKYGRDIKITLKEVSK